MRRPTASVPPTDGLNWRSGELPLAVFNRDRRTPSGHRIGLPRVRARGSPKGLRRARWVRARARATRQATRVASRADVSAAWLSDADGSVNYGDENGRRRSRSWARPRLARGLPGVALDACNSSSLSK